MSDWQERITYETAPAIRAEHELRYRAAAPLILRGGPWADLGCGNGLAADAALGGRAAGARAVLVDVEQESSPAPRWSSGCRTRRELAGDLTERDDAASG